MLQNKYLALFSLLLLCSIINAQSIKMSEHTLQESDDLYKKYFPIAEDIINQIEDSTKHEDVIKKYLLYNNVSTEHVYTVRADLKWVVELKIKHAIPIIKLTQFTSINNIGKAEVIQESLDFEYVYMSEECSNSEFKNSVIISLPDINNDIWFDLSFNSCKRSEEILNKLFH